MPTRLALAVRQSEPRMECYVAYLLGKDEDGPHELSIDMLPEDGPLRVCGVGGDGVTPFTEDAPLRNRWLGGFSGGGRRIRTIASWANSREM